MPTYVFRNKDTDVLEEHTMRMKELQDFKEKNPNLEVYISSLNMPGLGDGMRMSTPGLGQPDARFEREVIERIKKNVPGNNLHKSHKTKMPREW